MSCIQMAEPLLESSAPCFFTDQIQRKKPQNKTEASTFSKQCFHCCFVPNLHRDIEAHTSFQTFEHMEERAQCDRSCNIKVRGGSPFSLLLSALAVSRWMPHLQPVPLPWTEKTEAVAILLSIQRGSWYVRVYSQVARHIQVMLNHCLHPVLPFGDSGFISMAITYFNTWFAWD